MTESEWLRSEEPDLMLEQVMSTASRAQLVQFVRECWRRVDRYVPPHPPGITVVDQFAELADEQSNHDAAVYAAEAAVKAAGLAPDMQHEQRFQAALLRRIVGNPFRQ